jgi:hypothetical protein
MACSRLVHALVALPMLAAAGSAGAKYSLEVVARVGGPFPLGGIYSWVESAQRALNDEGQVAFVGGTATSRHVLVRGADGSVSVRVSQGDVAPDTGGAGFVAFNRVALNDAGEVAFNATVDTVPALGGIFRESAGTVTAVAMDGDPAPDLAPGTYVLGTTLDGWPSLAGNGDVAFWTAVGSGIVGMFVDSGGTDTKIVATGDPVPGGGSFYAPDAWPSYLSDTGDVTFRGFFDAPPNWGIFSASGGSIVPFVLEGDPSPAGGTFGRPPTPRANASGDVVFYENEAVFVSSGGTETLIVKTGDPAPGGTHDISSLSPALNDLGDVAFLSSVAGVYGIYVYRASTGAITRVAQMGDPIPGEGGATFGFPQDLSLNRERQIVFRAHYGLDPLPPQWAIYLASPPPPPGVPALGLGPTSILLAALALAGGLAAARRHA